jgi:hypothetical protein
VRGTSRKQTRVAEEEEEDLQIEAKVTKESVSYELLLSGNPQSYIDFYYLTHGQFDSRSFNEENLIHLKNRL